MNPGIFLTLTLLLQSAAPNQLPLRNTFLVAAETVIDISSTVDIKAADPLFTAQLQQLNVAKETLAALVNDDREKDIVADANNLVFLISACHIQSKDGAPTDKCESQLTRARSRMMDSLNMHKRGPNWLPGPPTPEKS